MEGVSGVNGTPMSCHFDKSRVLDVKPLRSLVPVFPNGNQGPPFVSAPPFGPYPSGSTPFYPFSPPQGYETTPDLNQTQNATPIQSYRTPVNNHSGVSDYRNREASHSHKTGFRSSQKKEKKKQFVFKEGSAADFKLGITPFEQANGNREIVNAVLMRFDALRRRLSQLEDVVDDSFRAAAAKAGKFFTAKEVKTNMKKRVGPVPGIEIGDIFFYRIELGLVGLHIQSMAGIDYMVISGQGPVATCIVSAGCYGDDTEDPDVLIYSGSGGKANNRQGKKDSDQQLVRGNLALEKSSQSKSVVRVVRGLKDPIFQASKVYFYDGLYTITETWVEKGESGYSAFKYKLVREPDQPPAFAIWQSIQRWKDGSSSRPGIILNDITCGAESVPVSLANEVDDEKEPAHFSYVRTVNFLEPSKLIQPSSCSCHAACKSGNVNCSCLQKNGGLIPYTINGILVSRKPLIYECGPTCPCFSDCKNKISQTGIKVRLEVFKTINTGWGLRLLDPIRAGTFICEYAGEVVDKTGEEDDYIFDTNRIYSPFKWNCESGFLEKDIYDQALEDPDIPSPLVISAKNSGNVARFMNHSCSPTVFWQPIVYGHGTESSIHIAFFAMKHIPPMTELTYDYGLSRANETDNGNVLFGKKRCFCGSPKCRGSFG